MRDSSRFFALGLSVAAFAACHAKDDGASASHATVPTTNAPSAAPRSAPANRPHLANRIAYIPPQCFAKTQDGDHARNPCYVCHTRSVAPNYTNDDDLQLSLRLPPLAATNPWTNLTDPPVAHAPHAPRASDAETLAYVRRSNYFDEQGNIALAAALASPPPEWDADHDGKWGGYVPDVGYAFDDRGFDHARDGAFTGWRAFAYFPFPGAFFPTNGSAGDVLIRLAPSLRQDASGRFDRGVYEVNLAIVEALVRRTDVRIDPVDERKLGVDLDLDGHLGRATRVAFDAAPGAATRMHYVGRAHAEELAGTLPIAPGLLPTGTELFHSVRYLDVREDGTVAMAPRMKELRYARKTQWASYAIARAIAIKDAREQEESRDGIHDVRWSEAGVYSARGWLLQGFIEAKDGSLRPQSYEESAYCEGCHGGIGATTDSTFSLARKLGDDAPARGWFHPSQHDLRGVPEPRREGGEYEYTLYLTQTGGADDGRTNDEARRRFFDERGALRADAVAKLHEDVTTLLLPSAARALDLDRAYRAIVDAQSFDKGRDAVLTSEAGDRGFYARVPLGQPTGVRVAVEPARWIVARER